MQFLNVTAGGTYSYHWTVNGTKAHQNIKKLYLTDQTVAVKNRIETSDVTSKNIRRKDHNPLKPKRRGKEEMKGRSERRFIFRRGRFY
jgi:hypothetical protein